MKNSCQRLILSSVCYRKPVVVKRILLVLLQGGRDWGLRFSDVEYKQATKETFFQWLRLLSTTDLLCIGPNLASPK